MVAADERHRHTKNDNIDALQFFSRSQSCESLTEALDLKFSELAPLTLQWDSSTNDYVNHRVDTK